MLVRGGKEKRVADRLQLESMAGVGTRTSRAGGARKKTLRARGDALLSIATCKPHSRGQMV